MRDHPFPPSDKQTSLEELLHLLPELCIFSFDGQICVFPLWDDRKMYQVVDRTAAPYKRDFNGWFKIGWCVFRKQSEAEIFKAYAALLLCNNYERTIAYFDREFYMFGYVGKIVDVTRITKRGVNLSDRRTVAVCFIRDMLDHAFSVEGIHTSILIQMISNAIALNSECLELLETALAKLASGERI